MLRRLAESVLVAVVASIVTWALSNPEASAGTADAVVDGAVQWVAAMGDPLRGWLWFGAVGLFMIGALLQVLSMTPSNPDASWQWGFSVPSLATTLMGLGLGLGLGLVGVAVGLAVAGSWWTLPLLTVVTYWGFRWVSDLRYRWTRMAGTL
jgi:hypothetical protein